jgi:isoquinoline 1-oxidoreductase beta subunit
MISNRPASSPSGSADASPTGRFSRRNILQTAAAAGGGLMLNLMLPTANDAAAAGAADTFTPNAFIRIGSDGQVVLTMPYVEMGQGT